MMVGGGGTGPKREKHDQVVVLLLGVDLAMKLAKR
jgi:hypothetical protein